MLKSLIPLLKLWLALSNETNNFNRCCPSMLHKRSVLNLYIQPGERPSYG